MKMLISDTIADLIEQMLDEGAGSAELKRNDLASRLGCVPSQINYVITSRFTPERGYLTESRRGGGGYIRIVRIPMGKSEYLMHFFHAVGDSLEENEARAYVRNLLDRGLLTDREANMAASLLWGGGLDRVPAAAKNAVRADTMRHILMALMR